MTQLSQLDQNSESVFFFLFFIHSKKELDHNSNNKKYEIRIYNNRSIENLDPTFYFVTKRCKILILSVCGLSVIINHHSSLNSSANIPLYKGFVFRRLVFIVDRVKFKCCNIVCAMCNILLTQTISNLYKLRDYYTL